MGMCLSEYTRLKRGAHSTDTLMIGFGNEALRGTASRTRRVQLHICSRPLHWVRNTPAGNNVSVGLGRSFVGDSTSSGLNICEFPQRGTIGKRVVMFLMRTTTCPNRAGC